MKKYKAIIFDLFDTIVHFDYQKIPKITTANGKGFNTIVQQSYHVFSPHYPHIDFSRFQEALHQIYKELLITKDIEHREIPAIERFRLLFQRLDIKITPEAEVYMEELVESHMDLLVQTTLLPRGNYGVLEKLSQNYPLALISNFDHAPTFYRILDIYDIRKFFQETIVSIEMGIRKPRKELFDEMLERLKTTAHESIYIGDNLRVDVAGSKNAGIDVVWFNKKKEQLREDVPQPDYIISHLRELLPIF